MSIENPTTGEGLVAAAAGALLATVVKSSGVSPILGVPAATFFGGAALAIGALAYGLPRGSAYERATGGKITGAAGIGALLAVAFAPNIPAADLPESLQPAGTPVGPQPLPATPAGQPAPAPGAAS